MAHAGMLPLDPPLPVLTPRGKGEAIVLIDPGREHHLQWVVILENGWIWTFENKDVRAQANPTIGRISIDIPESWLKNGVEV